MSDSIFWRFAAVMFIAGLFYIGSGTGSRDPNQLPTIGSKAYAGVGVADENSEVVFTSSQDGRKIYMWQYFGSKPPKFMGQAEAILSQ